ncbi:LexA family transcriptional regulator [Croceibacter atlanticus]|uniref:LexA family transcriptional regulator n=1 Tax=Croceibacter atlanticus TaxID=313588 RepID=UPI0024926530|nr:LexA family transcriptional regulator [Croceibacter atlanticus]
MGLPPTLEAKRFKQIREENNYTQTEFAELLGVKNTTADIERGRTKLSGKVIAELLRQFNVNPLWIFGDSTKKFLTTTNGDVSPRVLTVDSDNEDAMVFVNQKAAAGYPQNIHDVEWYQKLPAFNIPLPQYRNATYRGFQVEGDSMTPNLQPEDWVLAKAVSNITDYNINKVHVVVLQDSVLVKKLQKLPDPKKVLLVSFNEEYLPITVNVNDIQELWQVSSRLTFGVENTSESTLMRELQQSMEDLKKQINKFSA